LPLKERLEKVLSWAGLIPILSPEPIRLFSAGTAAWGRVVWRVPEAGGASEKGYAGLAVKSIAGWDLLSAHGVSTPLAPGSHTIVFDFLIKRIARFLWILRINRRLYCYIQEVKP
jgi:hypothetical protein